MLRLSRDFGKRENVAAVHPVDMLTSTSGTPGFGSAHRLPVWNSKV